MIASGCFSVMETIIWWSVDPKHFKYKRKQKKFKKGAFCLFQMIIWAIIRAIQKQLTKFLMFQWKLNDFMLQLTMILILKMT